MLFVCRWPTFVLLDLIGHPAFGASPPPRRDASTGKQKIPTSPCPLWLCGESIQYHLEKYVIIFTNKSTKFEPLIPLYNLYSILSCMSNMKQTVGPSIVKNLIKGAMN